jgi:hypothetical protein
MARLLGSGLMGIAQNFFGYDWVYQIFFNNQFVIIRSWVVEVLKTGFSI